MTQPLEDIAGSLQVPDAIEPIVAWRGWRVQRVASTGELRLVALHSNKLWLPGAAEAEPCLQSRCPATTVADALSAERNCRCGFHGWNERAQMLGYLRGTAFSVYDVMHIGGQCKLWGAVCRHEKGSRAQYACAGPVDEIRWAPALHGKRDLQIQVLRTLLDEYPELAADTSAARARLAWAAGERSSKSVTAQLLTGEAEPPSKAQRIRLRALCAAGALCALATPGVLALIAMHH
jgi:hypothetical protein